MLFAVFIDVNFDCIDKKKVQREQIMDISQNALPALGLTLLAGLCTGIGSLIAYLIRKPKLIYMSFLLGMSAGVMTYVSFMELLQSALKAVGEVQGLVFSSPESCYRLIDMLVPEVENPHHYEVIDASSDAPRIDRALMRIGIVTAAAIGIHNIPEGLAAFTCGLSNIRLGVFIATAIAIHNIPEGIAISIPIFYATGSKKKAFTICFCQVWRTCGCDNGLFCINAVLSEMLAFMLAFIAGIMVYISLDELLPAAHHYGQSHVVIVGVIFGMLIMAISLLML
jgi:ZIP family zinc transporter